MNITAPLKHPNYDRLSLYDAKVFEHLLDASRHQHPVVITTTQLSRATDIGRRKVMAILHLLEREGFIQIRRRWDQWGCQMASEYYIAPTLR